ncbi:MAG: hypothetical protein IIV74_04170 [Alphaproteobacteria bacterium]|nr:hypothetical protein [Alphaproteobacteria bacterium]
MRSAGDKILIVLLIVLILIVGAVLIFVMPTQDTTQSAPETTVSGPVVIDTEPVAGEKYIDFSDGLGMPDETTQGELDEFGTGIESVEKFRRDINHDGVADLITRTHVATGTAHDYHEYKIELNIDGKMRDITPDGFRTTHGAECALRLIQFHFKPTFGATIISRPFEESWPTPTMATKTQYSLNGDKITAGAPEQLGRICDVAELF